ACGGSRRRSPRSRTIRCWRPTSSARWRCSASPRRRARPPRAPTESSRWWRRPVQADRPPVTLRDRALLVKASPNLVGLDAEGQLLLAESARYRQYAPGDLIYAPGEALREVHMVFEGQVEVLRPGQPALVVTAPGGIGWPSF